MEILSKFWGETKAVDGHGRRIVQIRQTSHRLQVGRLPPHCFLAHISLNPVHIWGVDVLQDQDLTSTTGELR